MHMHAVTKLTNQTDSPKTPLHDQRRRQHQYLTYKLWGGGRLVWLKAQHATLSQITEQRQAIHVNVKMA